MLAIAAKSPNADSTHIAVLACLHLAINCACWSGPARLKERVDRKSEEFSALLDQLIAPTEPS